jgi:hypothetical protein
MPRAIWEFLILSKASQCESEYCWIIREWQPTLRGPVTDRLRASLQVCMDIRIDDLSSPEIAQLLQEHLRSAALHSPPESIHALDIEGLRKPEITFWSVWQGSELLG